MSGNLRKKQLSINTNDSNTSINFVGSNKGAHVKAKPTGILVSDFDLTFIDKHTKGHPIIGQNYFSSFDQYKNVFECLRQLKNKGWIIYINTRSIHKKVEAYLKFLHMDKMIDGVFGADSTDELAKSNIYWSRKKMAVLDHIRSLHNQSSKNDLFFLDDDYSNVNTAFLMGYEYAFQATSKSRSFISFSRFISNNMTRPNSFNDGETFKVIAGTILDTKFRLPECVNAGQKTKLYTLDNNRMILKSDLVKFVNQSDIDVCLTYRVDEKTTGVWNGEGSFPMNKQITVRIGTQGTSSSQNGSPE